MFKQMFPNLVTEELVYFPFGKDSICIRGVKEVKNRQDLIFSFNYNKSEWSLETMEHFLKVLKG